SVEPAPRKINDDRDLRWRSVIDLWASREMPQLAIREALRDSNLSVHKPAILAAWGTGARDTIPQLLHDVLGSDAGIRAYAIWAINSIGAPGEESVGTILDLLRSNDVELRGHGLYYLGQMGSAARAAAKPLGKMLLGNDKTFRRVAASALLMLQSNAEPAVP